MGVYEKIHSAVVWIRDFFVLMWQDEDRWLCIAGLIIVIIFVCKIVVFPLIRLFSGISDGISHMGSSSRSRTTNIKTKNNMKVTIKGVYQMNGPKPFVRELECSQSEVGYYTQLMSNKSMQSEWIQANFPGASVGRGFSMTVNIK